MAQTPERDRDAIADRFRRGANRFYLLNAVVLLLLAAALYRASQGDWYREGFIAVTVLFLLWLFNVGRLLRCPACGAVVRSGEGLIRMPRRCDSCGADFV